MAAPGAGPLRRTTGASGGSSSGNVTVVNTQAQAVPVSVSNFPATQPVSGSVTVSNLPATQPVSGTVSVSNFPATQPVSGTVAAAQSGTWTVSVSNFPATQPVSGSVSVSNFPATQPISGTVSLGAGTNLIGAVQARGTGSMVTGQVAMTAQNTAYQVAPARATRRSITFVPTSQFTYFYGNSGVTLTTGAAAVNGAAITLETTAAVFVISNSTGTMTFVEHF